ncbi:MAG: right-handed parallel beta-helix repeat-containing protein [Pseudonocardiaceae bacterium]
MMKLIRRTTVIVMIALAVLGVIITIPTTVHLAAASTYDRRIDIGSAQAVTDRDGNTWESQTGFSGGTIESDTTFTPSALLDDTVAKTALVGSQLFDIDVPNGTYTVTLYLLPTHTWPLDLWVESTIRAVVPLAAADQQRVIRVVSFDVPVVDHTLNMAFSPQANSLRLLAVQIRSKAADEVPTSGARPTPPPARMCSSPTLTGPAEAPPGAITVAAGDNSGVFWNQPGATFWFAPGTHTLGDNQFGQIIPADHTSFIGAPDAVLDGRGVNRYAFTQHAAGVSVRYLTIQNFGGPASNRDEGVVNHDAAPDWTIEHNTVQHNGGAGVFVGPGNVVGANCLKENGQYGFSMYLPTQGQLSNIMLDHNEIVANNTDDWESKIAGCGCTGGGKFWDAHAARVTNNWVHGNKSVGLWADTNNYDFLIAGNWIQDNDAEAIFYEISYNAVIRDNVIIGNAIVKGRSFAARNDNFPVAAIYLSEAGGDSRVPSTVAGTSNLSISNNYLQDNWNGITLWENSDRFCNSPANTSTAYCTRLANFPDCTAESISHEPNLGNCRWKTQHVKINGNDFRMNPANVGTCEIRYCGHMAALSNYGTYPSWSPYQATIVQQAVTFSQDNTWSTNTYTGRWRFMPFDTGHLIDFPDWQAAPYQQDPGSQVTGGG